MDKLREAIHAMRNEGDQRINGLINRAAFHTDPTKRSKALLTLHNILSMGDCSKRQAGLIRQLLEDREQES